MRDRKSIENNIMNIVSRYVYERTKIQGFSVEDKIVDALDAKLELDLKQIVSSYGLRDLREVVFEGKNKSDGMRKRYVQNSQISRDEKLKELFDSITSYNFTPSKLPSAISKISSYGITVAAAALSISSIGMGYFIYQNDWDISHNQHMKDSFSIISVATGMAYLAMQCHNYMQKYVIVPAKIKNDISEFVKSYDKTEVEKLGARRFEPSDMVSYYV